MTLELTTEERAVILDALRCLEIETVNAIACVRPDSHVRGYFEGQKTCVQRIKTKLEEAWRK